MLLIFPRVIEKVLISNKYELNVTSEKIMTSMHHSLLLLKSNERCFLKTVFFLKTEKNCILSEYIAKKLAKRDLAETPRTNLMPI